jgi:hypothetical protein
VGSADGSWDRLRDLKDDDCGTLSVNERILRTR